ncbi:MAG: SPOR domain-containing protein [Saprospiraceae bacterium]|nr:SPOR domain-containing protein [Saprospiraceae bacterium]
MKSNSLVTYVIYTLLLALILVAGYKACQIRQEQALQAKEREELEQVMRDLGYSANDTSSGSSYLGANDTSATKTSPAPAAKPGSTTAPKVSASGIEDDAPTSAPQTATKQSPAATAPKTTTTTSAPGSTAPSSGNLTSKAPSYGGRYMVITGAFKQMENARDEMETLVKAGYRNAEVKRFTSAWAHVIALRTNDRAAAERAVEKLKAEGYSGAYVKDGK